MTRIDLHSHSTRSDGRETPREVFEQAALAKVDILALTDHDTTSGWAEAAETASRLGLGFVPGIEVTTRAETAAKDGKPRGISVHMLAYLPDPNYEPLARELAATVLSRETRAQRIVELLSVDYDITWELVTNMLEEGATIGRPALADALIHLGHFENRAQAFDGPLDKHGPYYVATKTTDTLEAIQMIRAAGGVPIIAHPLGGVKGSLNRGDLPQAYFETMIEAGLAGFEVYHREVSGQAREWLLELAEQHDLIVTGSSDYHGIDGKPNRLGENSTEREMLDRILAQASGTNAQI